MSENLFAVLVMKLLRLGTRGSFIKGRGTLSDGYRILFSEMSSRFVGEALPLPPQNTKRLRDLSRKALERKGKIKLFGIRFCEMWPMGFLIGWSPDLASRSYSSRSYSSP